MAHKKVCCFTGSRPQKLPYGFREEHPDCIHLKNLMRQEIEYLILNESVSHFITGMALGVDQWAAELVLALKTIHPHISLEAAIPCEMQSLKWSKCQQERYFFITSQCDKITLLQKAYTNDCMRKRNRYMVDSSQSVLAVWAGTSGGTSVTIKYAQEQNRKMICIHPETFDILK